MDEFQDAVMLPYKEELMDDWDDTVSGLLDGPVRQQPGGKYKRIEQSARAGGSSDGSSGNDNAQHGKKRRAAQARSHTRQRAKKQHAAQHRGPAAST